LNEASRNARLSSISPNGRRGHVRTARFRTAKPNHKLVRVSCLLEAVNMEPLAVVIERVASGAECQVSAKLVDLIIAVALAKPRWEHDLVRPLAINCSRRQFAFAPHVQTAG
jgi:hypothetical protein